MQALSGHATRLAMLQAMAAIVAVVSLIQIVSPHLRSHVSCVRSTALALAVVQTLLQTTIGTALHPPLGRSRRSVALDACVRVG